MPTIELHAAQSEIIGDLFGPNPDYKQRFEVVVGSRGLGKSWVAAAAAVLAAGELESLSEDVPNKNISILCGSYSQVTDIYFPLLAYTFGLEASCTQSSYAAGKFWLPRGTEIQCRSSENVDRMRGTGQYLVVCDEMPSWMTRGSNTAEAWDSVIEPCITTRWSPQRARELGAPSPGRGLMIASPLGKDFFYELAMREAIDDRWKTRYYDYTKSPFLDAKIIEQTRRVMDPLRFSREYLATFEDTGARVYYCFSRKDNVRSDLEPFTDSETVHCAIDFNVFRNCTTFNAIRGGQVFTLDESEGTANTEELAKLIRRRYPKNRIVCYPDPAGRQRKTSAAIGATDFSILKEAGFEVLARPKSPPIVDSVAAINRMFCNANGEHNWFISHTCHGAIKSLDRTVWLENRPDSAIIDKTQNVEHYSDGMRYLAEYLFPIQFETVAVRRAFTF